MPNFDPTREFHDELLSAYLDDELSPAERTRVDERLAVDPVARQMLEELRTVSQAVQILPHETLGEDLRSAILLRAQQVAYPTPIAQEAAPLPVSTASPVSAGGHPRFTFGRTRRGWVWAALAVAAALVIMFLQPDTLREEKLPQVAAGDAKREVPELRSLAHDSTISRGEGEQLGVASGSQPAPDYLFRRQVEQFFDDKSAPSNSTMPTTPPAVVLDAMSDSGAKQSAEGIAFNASGRFFGGAESDKRDDTLQLGTGLGDAAQLKRLVEPGAGVAGPGPGLIDASRDGVTLTQPGGPAGALGTADFGRGTDNVPAAPAEKPSTVSPPIRDGVVVVYVDVKPDAFRNLAIDQKLATNGIALDAATDAAPDAARSRYVFDGAADFFETNARDTYLAMNVDASPQPTDAILVEAPAAQIAGLIGALDADVDNVVRISVDDKNLADNAAQTTKLASVDWSRYQRVSLPAGLLDRGRAGSNQSFQIADTSNTTASGSNLGGRAAGRSGGGGGGGRGGARGGGRGAMPAATSGPATQAAEPMRQSGGSAPVSESDPTGSRQAAARADAAARTPLSTAAKDEAQSMSQAGADLRGYGVAAGNSRSSDRGAFGGIPASGMGEQRPLGRATRIATSPATTAPLHELQQASKAAHSQPAKPADTSTTEWRMFAEQSDAARGAEAASATARPVDVVRETAPPVGGQAPTGQPSQKTLIGGNAAAGPAAAREGERSGENMGQSRRRESTIPQPEGSDSLQVLLVLRPAAASPAARAADTSAKPATSPAGSDPAK
ncbi:MAG: zf-HC2 domain-containing protein [Pirellulales bacterium]